MSNESTAWLNTQVLIGHTDRRGRAYHYSADLQGERSNHYSGAIPLADVRNRLFSWHAELRPIAVDVRAGGLVPEWRTVDGKRAVCRSDDRTGAALALVSEDYELHQYDEWLLGTAADLVGDELDVRSAGLLRNGAIAWVELSLPQRLIPDAGVSFHPNLLLTTSHDGNGATIYKRTITDVVCDNTRKVALKEKSPEVRQPHRPGAALPRVGLSTALGLLHDAAAEFETQVRELVDITVTDLQWDRIVESWLPLEGCRTPATRQNMAQRRERLHHLYREDRRVLPWRGTAHGALQAINTWETHGPYRRDRVAANAVRLVQGRYDDVDRRAWAMIAGVLDMKL